MKAVLSVVIICCFFGSFLPAQTVELSGYALQQNMEQFGNQSLSSLVRTFNFTPKNTRGFPYWRNEWLSGRLIWLNGSKLDNVPMKLITFKTTALSAKLPNGDSIVVPIRNFKVAIMIDPATKDSIFLKRIIHSESPNGELLRVIHDGEFAIVARQTSTLIPANNTGAYNAGRDYDEFVQKTDYFLYKSGTGVLQKMKLTKKALFEMLPGKEAELNTFVKSNQLNIDKEKDAARLAAYYEQLLKP
jgi:hypothetical protein